MVDQVVVLAFGPVAVTRAAIRRAGQLVGVRGTVVVVPALPSSRAVVDGLHDAKVVAVDGVGAPAIRRALESCRSGPVLMVHDDVMVPAESVRRMSETWRRVGGFVVPWTNDREVDHCVGPLPPLARAAQHVTAAMREVRRREATVYCVRPDCVLGSRDDLAHLTEHQIDNPYSLLSDAGGVYHAAAGAVAVHDADCLEALSPPTSSDGRPLLVANLIVRDEEEMLGDCLASLEGLVDRIELCDTGSTDRTVEIARSYGIDVIEREWRNDFGWARNEVLDRSRDAHFVVMVDADERIRCSNPTLVRRLLATFAGSTIGYEIGIDNLNDDRSSAGTVEFWDTRIFSTRQTRWIGSIHEKVHYINGLDGIEGAEGEAVAFKGHRLSALSIEHLGYLSEVVEGRDKTARNLEICEAAYLEDPTGRTAFELGRALVYAGQTGTRALACFEEALSRPGLATDIQAMTHGFAAKMLVGLDRFEDALEHANQGVELWPALDFHTEVQARLCEALDRPEVLVGAIERIRSSPPLAPLFTDVNGTASTLSRLVWALARTGRFDDAYREAQALLDERPQGLAHWEALLRAGQRSIGIEDLLPRYSALALRSVGPGAVDAAVEVLASDALLVFLRSYIEAGGREPNALTAALTASMVGRDWSWFESLLPLARLLDDSAVGGIVQRLEALGYAKAAADLRRAVDGTGDAAGAPRAVERGVTLSDLVPSESRVLELTGTGAATDSVAESVAGDRGGLAAGSIDVVVLEPAAGDGVFDAVSAAEVVRVLDGAGLVVARVAADRSDAACAELAAAGITVERQARDHRSDGSDAFGYGWFVVGRPSWDAATIERAIDAIAEYRVEADLALVFIGDPGPAGPVGVRASLPSRLGLRVLGVAPDTAGVAALLADLEADRPVLVVTADIVPAAEWIQSLWDGWCEYRVPVCVRVVDPDGRVVHAGADGSGTVFAAGAVWGRAPIVTVDRPRAGLAAPMIATAGALRAAGGGSIAGRYLGRAAAVSQLPAPIDTAGAPLARVFGPAVVFLGDRSVVDLPDAERDGLLAAAGVLHAAGLQPVYRWEDMGAPWLRPDHSPYEAAGLLLFGGDPHTDAPDRKAWEQLVPRPAGVVGAVAAKAVVHCSARSLEDDFAVCTLAALDAITAYAGDDRTLGTLTQRVDIVATGVDAALAQTIVERIGAPRPEHVARHASFSRPVAPRDGVVSVVIPVWNNWKLTRACVDSLVEHAEAPLEIVIVDNGSTDGTARGLAELAERSDVNVIVVTNESNRGFPTAVNQGIAASSGELVCVLNNDTEVTPGWLTEMLAALERPGTGMVGPRSNSISGLQIIPDAPPMRDRSAVSAWARRWSAERAGRSWPTARLVGFCLLARRELFERLGGFDEGFGIGNFEDDDLCARVRAQDLTLRVADGSVVLHHGSATFKELGLDFAAVMATAGKRFGGRGGPSGGLVHGVVLSDGDPSRAAVSAQSLLAVADRVTVLERAGLGATEIVLGEMASSVRAVAVDWSRPDDATAAVAGIAERSVLVLGAGERLVARDWGASRSEIEGLLDDGRLAAELRLGATASEVRFHVARPDLVAAIGSSSDVRLACTSLLPPAPDAGAASRGDALPLASTAVVVVTYNSASTIGDCLDSVLRHDPCDLVVVDNASTDGTATWLAEYALQHPGVRVIASDTNVGFSAGCNLGIESSSAEYVVLLNPDTVVTEHWLRRMQSHFDAPGSLVPVGAVGPVSDTVAGAQKWGWYLSDAEHKVADPDTAAARLVAERAGQSIPTRLLIGFCLMVPRAVLDEVGWLDPELFLGNDDLDLSWRLRRAGYDLRVAIDTFIQHEGQVSFRSEPQPVTKRLVEESTDALARKLLAHYGPGLVPTSEELWGMAWFTPSFDLWGASARHPILPFPAVLPDDGSTPTSSPAGSERRGLRVTTD